MTQTMTQPQMAAWDAGTLEYMTRQAHVQGRLDRLMARAHQVAGDKKRGFGGPWISTHAEVLQALRDGGIQDALLAEIDEHERAVQGYRSEIDKREAVWEENGCWSRYFPCLNRDGHIHSSLRGCPTVRFDTSMGWAAEYSGLTAGQAIQGIPGQFEGLGETLCSVCFPGAPVEWCRTRTEIEREAREAAKAEREAAKYVKRLFPSEQFRTAGRFGERVETVAKCKELLRLEVELRDYYGRGEHPDHTASVADAQQAAKVLLAREERQAGTGATQAQVDQIIANAVKANRKNGARI